LKKARLTAQCHIVRSILLNLMALTALASYQNPRAWLNTKFGKSRGQHNYIFPDAFDDNTCQSGIKAI